MLPSNSGLHNFGFVGAAVVGFGNRMVVGFGNRMVVGFFGCVLEVLNWVVCWDVVRMCVF